MATLATLTVDLAANSAKFRSELAKANKSSNGFAKNAKAAAGAASKAFIASAAATATALAGVTRSYLKSVDSLAKTSDKLGIATEDLTRLRFAAELTGVEQGKLDVALQRFTRRTSEAANGTGEAVNAFEELGLSAKDLLALPVTERMQVLAGAFEGVETQADRVRLAFKLFDTEGVDLVNTLALGEKGLAAMTAEADALGITVSRFDAAKVEAANDAMFKARSTFDSFGNTLAVEFAPLLAAVADLFIENAKEAGGFGKVALSVVESTVQGFGFAADAIRGVKVAALGAKVAFAGLGLGVIEIVTGTVDGLIGLGNIIRRAILLPIQGVLKLAAPFSEKARAALESVNGLANADVTRPEFLTGVLESQIATFDGARKAFSDAVLEPLPSEKIEAFVLNARTAIEEAGAKVASEASARALPTFNAGGEDGEEPKTQEEKLAEAQSFYDAKANMLSQFSAFSKQTSLDLLTFDKQTDDQKLASRKAIGRELLGGLAKDSKAAFKVQQAMSIADTVMNTYTAAQGAYAAMAGIPIVGPALGIAAAAAAIAFGAKQVQAIKAQKLGGSGSVTTGKPGGVTASGVGNSNQPQGVPAINTDSRTNGTPQQINLTVTGDYINSRDFAEAVNGSLTELYKDGARAPITVVAA